MQGVYNMDSDIDTWIPIPYFQINQEGTILNSSNRTHSYFYPTSNIWHIVHKEDRSKIILKLSQSTNSQPETEYLVLQTSNKLFVNFKCTIQWKDDMGHLVCIERKSVAGLDITPFPIQTSLANTKKRLEGSEKSLNTAAKIISLRRY